MCNPYKTLQSATEAPYNFFETLGSVALALVS